MGDNATLPTNFQYSLILIHTGLQPGDGAHPHPSRFNGLSGWEDQMSKGVETAGSRTLPCHRAEKPGVAETSDSVYRDPTSHPVSRSPQLSSCNSAQFAKASRPSVFAREKQPLERLVDCQLESASVTV